MSNQFNLNIMNILKSGTVLVPKSDCKYPYKKRVYVVTEEDEKNSATIGDNWMIKH